MLSYGSRTVALCNVGIHHKIVTIIIHVNIELLPLLFVGLYIHNRKRPEKRSPHDLYAYVHKSERFSVVTLKDAI